jgi:hypothetical protein
MFVTMYKTAWHHNLKDHNPNCHCHENLKSHIKIININRKGNNMVMNIVTVFIFYFIDRGTTTRSLPLLYPQLLDIWASVIRITQICKSICRTLCWKCSDITWYLSFLQILKCLSPPSTICAAPIIPFPQCNYSETEALYVDVSS